MNGRSKYAKGEEWKSVCESWANPKPRYEAEMWATLMAFDEPAVKGQGKRTLEARLWIVREKLLAREPAE